MRASFWHQIGTTPAKKLSALTPVDDWEYVPPADPVKPGGWAKRVTGSPQNHQWPELELEMYRDKWWKERLAKAAAETPEEKETRRLKVKLRNLKNRLRRAARKQGVPVSDLLARRKAS